MGEESKEGLSSLRGEGTEDEMKRNTKRLAPTRRLRGKEAKAQVSLRSMQVGFGCNRLLGCMAYSTVAPHSNRLSCVA